MAPTKVVNRAGRLQTAVIICWNQPANADWRHQLNLLFRRQDDYVIPTFSKVASISRAMQTIRARSDTTKYGRPELWGPGCVIKVEHPITALRHVRKPYTMGVQTK